MMLGKILIWSLVALFGYVCILLMMGVFLVQSEMENAMKSLPPHEGAEVVLLRQDSYLTLLPGTKFSLYPHRWAAALLGVGVSLVVLGLVFLLHVPVKDRL